MKLLKKKVIDYGVILLNLGSPETIDGIYPFLKNLFFDKNLITLSGWKVLRYIGAPLIAKLRTKKVIDAYKKIGGKSPLLKLTLQQAQSLEEKFLSEGFYAKVFVGMRYSPPFIKESLFSAINNGVKTIVAIPLYPQYSIGTTGSIKKEIERVIKDHKLKINFHFVERFYNNPAFIQSLVSTIKESKLFSQDKNDFHILFTAHSIPLIYLKKRDPYQSEIEQTLKLVMKNFEAINYSLAYQSAVGPVKWLGPKVYDEILRLRKIGIKKILVVPLSFVSDNFETLYEIDYLDKNFALQNGIEEFERVKALNAHPLFIQSIFEIIKNILDNGAKKWIL